MPSFFCMILFRIFRQIVDDGLDANFDAAGGLGGIQIAEFEEQRACRFHDFLRRRVGGLVHAAFVARQPQHAGNPRKPRGEFRSPHNFVRVAAVGRRPHVRDVEGDSDSSRASALLRTPSSSGRRRSGRYCSQTIGIAVRLQVGFDFVADSRVHVIGPREHQDARFLFAAHQVRISRECLRAFFGERARAAKPASTACSHLGLVHVQDVLQAIVHLLGDHIRIGDAQRKERRTGCRCRRTRRSPS